MRAVGLDPRRPATTGSVTLEEPSCISLSSSVVLEELDRLELSISTINFSYTSLDRRRALQKLVGVAATKQLPPTWRAARRSLTPRQFKVCLERQMVPCRLSPKEFGALVDIFGNPSRQVDTREFAIFFSELGSIERTRKLAARRDRMVSVAVTRAKKSRRLPTLPKATENPKQGRTNDVLVSPAQRRSCFASSGRSRVRSRDSDSWRKSSTVSGGARTRLASHRGRHRPSGADALFAGVPLLWDAPPTADEVLAEKDAFRTAMTKLCAAASLFDGLTRDKSRLASLNAPIPEAMLAHILVDLLHVRLSKIEVKALCSRFSCPGKSSHADGRALRDQFLTLGRIGLRERVSEAKKVNIKDKMKHLTSLKAIDLMKLGTSQSCLVQKDTDINELVDSLRQSIETNLRYRVTVAPFAEKVLQNATLHLVLKTMECSKVRSRKHRLAMELCEHATEDGSALGEWTAQVRGNDGSALCRKFLAAWANLHDKKGARKKPDLDLIATHRCNTARMGNQQRRCATDLEREQIRTIVTHWKNLMTLPAVPISMLFHNIPATREAYSVVGSRVVAWASRRLRARRISQLKAELRNLSIENAARRIQDVVRRYLDVLGYNYSFKLRTLAALTIQGMWQSQCRLQLERRKYHHDYDLKLLNAVLDLQRWWKRAMARQHIKQLAHLRSHQNQDISARRIQLQFRIMLANRVLMERRQQRARDVENSAIILQNKWRSRQQRKCWLEGLRQYRSQRRIAATVRMHLVSRLSAVTMPTSTLDRIHTLMSIACPLFVKVHRASSLRSGALSGSPRVFVTAYHRIEHETDDAGSMDATAAAASTALETRDSTFRSFPSIQSDIDASSSSISLQLHRQIAFGQTQPAVRTRSQDSKEWNEELLINGVECSASLAFTVGNQPAKKGNSCEYDFLGQAELNLSRAPPGYMSSPSSPTSSSSRSSSSSGSPPSPPPRRLARTGVWWSLYAPTTAQIDWLRLPLRKMSKEVEIERGRLLRLKNRDRCPSGDICVSVRLAPRPTSMCGYLMRKVELVLTTRSWKLSWAVLADGMFRIYNGRGEVTPSHEMDIRHIIIVDFDIDDEVISVVVAGSGAHRFRVPEGDYAAFFRRMWLRKLRRACPFIPTNEYIIEELSHQSYMKQSTVSDQSSRMRDRRRSAFLLV